ncbi:MAG: hypothetical protein RSB51_05155 [Clostridia bacterium]
MKENKATRKIMVPLNVANYQLGGFTFWDDYTGAYFNVAGNQLRFKIVFTSYDYNVNAPEFYLGLQLLQSGVPYPLYSIYKSPNGVYTNWMSSANILDYKFSYSASVAARPDLHPHVQIKVYVETRNV